MSLMSRTSPEYGAPAQASGSGRRTGCGRTSRSRGRLPLGSFIQRTNFGADTTPTVHVIAADDLVRAPHALERAVGLVEHPRVDPRAARRVGRHRLERVAARRLAPDHPVLDGAVVAGGGDHEVGVVAQPRRHPLLAAVAVGPVGRALDHDRAADAVAVALGDDLVERGRPDVGGIGRVAADSPGGRFATSRQRQLVLEDAHAELLVDRERRGAVGHRRRAPHRLQRGLGGRRAVGARSARGRRPARRGCGGARTWSGEDARRACRRRARRRRRTSPGRAAGSGRSRTAASRPAGRSVRRA